MRLQEATVGAHPFQALPSSYSGFLPQYRLAEEVASGTSAMLKPLWTIEMTLWAI
jgi:hypothetical protein